MTGLTNQVKVQDATVTKRISITSLAGIFVILVCLSLVFVDGWRSWTARKIQLHEATIATSNMARALAQHADDTIKEADTALVGLVERVQTDGISPSALARLHKFLELRVDELPQLNGLYVYNENGQWLTNSQPTTASNVNNADRDYFIYHRTHANPGPYIGLPIQSRSTGDWILTISRRINHADGSFAGVVLATISIDYFNKFYDSFDIGHDGAIALVLDSGIMFTRRPLLNDSIGKNVSHSQLLEVARKGKAGTTVFKSGQDGIRRIFSFRRLDQYPLFVSAALSESEVLQDWLSDTYLHSAGVGFLLLVLGLVGFNLVGQIKRRVEAEAEIVRTRDALETVNQTLQKLSLQDGLTGLSNRRHFDIALEKEFSRAKRNTSSLALVMIDVDCFKQYNDIYGHAAGDECLRRLSQVVKASQHRSGDVAARYGGEELCVLLPGTDVGGALLVAEKIRMAIRNLAIEHTGNPAGIVTISAGVDAFIPIKDENMPLELIQGADTALYSAKTSGRDRVLSNVNFVHRGQ